MRNPLMRDWWNDEDDVLYASGEFGKIQRARYAIWAIARMVGNSVQEPGMSGAAPLDGAEVSWLLGGVEVLADAIGDACRETEDRLKQIEQYQQARDMQSTKSRP